MANASTLPQLPSCTFVPASAIALPDLCELVNLAVDLASKGSMRYQDAFALVADSLEG